MDTLLQRVLKRKIKVRGAERQMQIREALIRKLRELALSGDRRAISLQQRILEEASVDQMENLDLEAKKQRILDAFRRMGVKVKSEGDRDAP